MGSPALMDAQSTRILEQLNALGQWYSNNVRGGLVTDGGTTQGSGASTAPNLDLDVSEVDSRVDGIVTLKAASTDIDSDAGDTVDFGATSGKEVVCAVVLEQDGTYSLVPGAVADTGEGVAPTDAEIDTAVEPSTTTWIRVANVTFERTGDTAITVAVDHGARPSAPVAFVGNLATTETEFQQVA